jgi:hypothetical protein
LSARYDRNGVTVDRRMAPLGGQPAVFRDVIGRVLESNAFSPFRMGKGFENEIIVLL